MSPNDALSKALHAAWQADAAVSLARRARFFARSASEPGYQAACRAYEASKDVADAAWRECDRIADAMVAAGEPDPRMQDPA